MSRTPAVGYFRISGKQQGMLRAELEGQRQKLRGHVASSGLQLVGEFVDYENGSRSPFLQLEKAIKLCQQRRAVLVLPKVGLLLRDWGFLSQLHAADIDIAALDASGLSRASVGELAVVARRSDRRLLQGQRKAPVPPAAIKTAVRSPSSHPPAPRAR